MPAAARRWTATEVRALIEEDRPSPRYELIDGELLVTPSPGPLHQRTIQVLYGELLPYVERQRLGEVWISPADLELEPDSVLQPDVFVAPECGEVPLDSWSVVRSLLLAIEVLSKGSGRRDRVIKRRCFQRVGVPDYWVVDPRGRVVERWRPGDERPEVLDRQLDLHPGGAAEPFTLDLPAFFARVHREPTPG